MKTLQENLETVENCRALKYENSLEYEQDEASTELKGGVVMLKICVKHSITYDDLEQFKGICPVCYHEQKAKYWEEGYALEVRKNIEMEAKLEKIRN